jgi:lipopolysaccharide transport system permease protein
VASEALETGGAAPTRRHVRVLPTSGTPRLDFRELWDGREIFQILMWRDIKVRYKQSLLGAAWAILQPLLTMIVFSVFLGLLAKVPSRGAAYPLMVYAGLIPWTFFSTGLAAGGMSLIANEQLLTKVYFPRLLIPAASVLACLVDLACATVVIVPLWLIYGQYPDVQILLLPLGLLLVAMAGLGLAFWLSAINVKYRDVRYAMAFLIQILFYVSPIAYPITLVPERFWLVYGLDPLAGVTDLFRGALIATPVHWSVVGVSFLTSAVLLVTGARHFRRMERSFADVI